MTREQATLPSPDDARALVAAELAWVRDNVGDGGAKDIGDVQTFWRTAPGPAGDDPQTQNRPRKPRVSLDLLFFTVTLTRRVCLTASWYTNPQTEALARLLQMPNKVNPVPAGMAPPRMVQGGAGAAIAGEGASVGADDDAEAAASSIRDREIVSPDVGMEEESAVTDAHPPIASGGWSPSRIVD